MDIMTNIRESYDSLSRTQKQIADYVVNHPHEVCFVTLRVLAKSIGTSEATILSFCSKLESGNFLGLKHALRQYTSEWVSPTQKIKFSSEKLGSDESSIEKIMFSERNCLEHTFDHLNTDSLRRFVQALEKADRIHVVGHGTSATVALYLQVRLQQIGYRAGGLNILDHRAVVYEAANAGDNDLFVLIAFPRYAPQTVALAEYLLDAPTHSVCITDKAHSPVARCSEASLLCNTDSILFYNSMTSPMALVNLVCSMLVLESRDKFEKHIDRLDSIEEFLRRAQMAASGNDEQVSFPRFETTHTI